MKFQGEECVLNLASYFSRTDVVLNGTFWVRHPAGESVRYQQPWLHFTHTLSTSLNDDLRAWLRAVAAGKPVEPLLLPGQIRQVYQIATLNPHEISLEFQYSQSPEPRWWAWAITEPLQIRVDIPRNEFAHLITVFDAVDWSFY